MNKYESYKNTSVIIHDFVHSKDEVRPIYEINRTLLDTMRIIERCERLFLIADMINKASSVLQRNLNEPPPRSPNEGCQKDICRPEFSATLDSMQTVSGK